MQSVWRQKRSGQLTPAQQQAKLQKDAEYETAVRSLSSAFYAKKRSVGVTPEEEAAYRQQKADLWNGYKTWAIAQGLYHEVTPQQQLAEQEEALGGQLQEANELRASLGLKPVELREAST